MAPFNQFRPRNPYDPYDNSDQLIPSDASQIRQGQIFGQFGQPLQQSGSFDDPVSRSQSPDAQYENPPDVASQIPNEVPGGEWQGTPPQQKSNWDLLQERWKGYTPSHAASDRYSSYIDSAPVRPQPGLGRRIMAGAAAFSGGPQAADEIEYGGYNRDMKDWAAKVSPYQNAAELENRQNINERGQYATMGAEALQMDKQDEIARKDRETAANNQLKAEAYQIRTEALDWKAKHGTWTVEAKGDRIIAVNPTTHETQDMGPSHAWDQYQLQNLKNAGALAASAAQGQNAAGIQAESQRSTDYNLWQKSLEDADKAKRVSPQDIPKVVQTKLQERYLTDRRVRELGWITRDDAGQYNIIDAKEVAPENLEEFVRLIKDIFTVNNPPYVRPQPPVMPKSEQGVPSTVPSPFKIPNQEPQYPSSLSFDKGMFGPGGEQQAGGGRDTYVKDHVNQPPKYQQNSKGEVRVSYDGGVTWRPYTGGR